MGDVPAGLYEHLLTARLAQQLGTINSEQLQLGSLDPADAHEILTRHIAGLAHLALRLASGSDAAAIGRQVELTNRIVAAIAELAVEAASHDDAVSLDLSRS